MSVHTHPKEICSRMFSFFHNHQKLETVQTSTNTRMDKESVLQLYSELLPGNKKGTKCHTPDHMNTPRALC